MTTNMKTPTEYELSTIAEHAMRRLFQAQGRSWEDFTPDDAQRREWIIQALTTADQGLSSLGSERGDWKTPKRTNLRPVVEVAAIQTAPKNDALAEA